MKRYTIGLITGVLLTASAFMFMGATTNAKEFGLYQHSTTHLSKDDWTGGQVYLVVTNTKTGEIHSTAWMSTNDFKYFSRK